MSFQISDPLQLAAISLLTITLFWRFISRSILPQHYPGIPSFPNPTYFGGDLKIMLKFFNKSQGSFAYVLQETCSQLGTICQLRLSFGNTCILINDCYLAQAIYSRTSGIDQGLTVNHMFGGVIPKGMPALTSNAMFKQHRRIMAPAMSTNFLRRSVYKINNGIQDLLTLWEEKRVKTEGKAWSSGKDISNAVMETICTMTFGESCGILATNIDGMKEYEKHSIVRENGTVEFDLPNSPVSEAMSALMDTTKTHFPFPRLRHFFIRWTKKFRHDVSIVNNFIANSISLQRREAKLKGVHDAFETADSTLAFMVVKEMEGEKMSDGEMRDETLTYIIGGSDTSASTLTWWTRHMTQEPELQKRLRKHLLDNVPELQDRPPTYDDLLPDRTPLVEAIFYEVLRLHSPVVAIPRHVLEDIVVGGYLIPKGANIYLPFTAMRNDSPSTVSDPDLKPSKFWTTGDVDEFKPDRWLNEKGEFDPDAGPWLAFGAGPRGCFGRNLAMLQMRLFIAQINLKYFLEPLEEELMSMRPDETHLTRSPRWSWIRPRLWSEVDQE